MSNAENSRVCKPENSFFMAKLNHQIQAVQTPAQENQVLQYL